MGAMVELFPGPIFEKFIRTGFKYLKDHRQELERLRNILPQIQAVVHYASILEHIDNKYPALNTWLWHLRDVMDEVKDVMEELTIKKEKTEVRLVTTSSLSGTVSKSVSKYRKKLSERARKNDPTLKRLGEVVHKLYEVSSGAATFLHLVKEAKKEHQEQQLELNRARNHFDTDSHSDAIVINIPSSFNEPVISHTEINMTDENAEPNGSKKSTKITCTAALSLTVGVIIVVVEKSGSTSRGGHIVLKASTFFALLGFLAGIILLKSNNNRNVERWLVFIAIISMLIAIVLLYVNVIM